MKLGRIDTYQNFRANLDNNNRKSFMGQFAEGITDVVNTTAKVTDGFSDFSDILISTKDALSSPEKATVGILKDQIEDKVVNNENAPGWLRKTATYATAVLLAGATFYAASKMPITVKTFANNTLRKTDLGIKLLNSLVSVKQSVSRLANSFGIDPVKNALGRVNNLLEEKLPQKITNILRRGAEFTKLDKLKNWTAGDYAKNAIAGFMGYKAGKRFLDKHQDKLTNNNDVQKIELPKTDEVKEAA